MAWAEKKFFLIDAVSSMVIKSCGYSGSSRLKKKKTSLMKTFIWKFLKESWWFLVWRILWIYWEKYFKMIYYYIQEMITYITAGIKKLWHNRDEEREWWKTNKTNKTQCNNVIEPSFEQRTKLVSFNRQRQHTNFIHFAWHLKGLQRSMRFNTCAIIHSNRPTHEYHSLACIQAHWCGTCFECINYLLETFMCSFIQTVHIRINDE